MRSRLIAVVAAIMLTGCGTGHATTTARAGATGPAPGQGPQAKALALARRLVAEVRVPPGTKPVHLSTLPPSLRSGPMAPSGPGWASTTRILAAPGNAVAVADALLAHAPFGDGSPRSVPVTVSTRLESPEPGVDAAVVEVSVMQYSRTTALLAVRAFAAWLPVRTAVEHLDPARIRAVTLTEVLELPAHGQVRRTLTSRAVIARLATLLNRLKPAVFESAECPAPVVGSSFTLTFTPANGNGSTVVVSASGCGPDVVTVNGASQPPLSDPDDSLLALARELAGS